VNKPLESHSPGDHEQVNLRLMFDALIYDSDEEAWLRFTGASSVYIAKTNDDVTAVLDIIEAACAKGKFAVGYVSFEAASAFDSALVHHPSGSLPLAAFAIFDHAEETSRGAMSEPLSEPLDLNPVIDESDFFESIEQIKAYLRSGDSYQVNFTHQLKGNTLASPGSIFSFLCRAQPSPYSAFIETGDYAICSVSPELFFEVNGASVRTEPMKGTRPRGRFPEEDAGFRSDLVGSEKDRAENLMIVDMVRNDLGKIAVAGSVCAEELFSIKRFPTVWQQVSSISAKTDASLGELFSALFPCASVTGAPKARAMGIIRELETEARGVYTGAIGLVKPGRRARFSVAIRTLTLDKHNDIANYGVGGGIVWDSDPDEEWQESLTKAKILSFDPQSFRLFETMLYEPMSGVFLLNLHLDRLEASAHYFGFDIYVDSIRTRLCSLQLLKRAKLRLLLGSDGDYELEEYPLSEVKSMVMLKLASRPVNSHDIFLFHKTTRRDVYDEARNDVDHCDDVILWNEKNELTETTIANLFLEIDGELLTSPVECGLLAGTYRRYMLENGRAKEAVLRKSDLVNASKIYVANSMRGLREARLVE
jgi:para-aminobenzoate synthetase/4-amino-4-deoxychorismate lyase